MSLRLSSGALVVLLCASAPAAAQSLSISFKDGTVTLRARSVPVRTILAEWSRQGGTQIVHGERVPGGPVTLELTAVPEREAIDALLRDASGYMIGASAAGGAATSTVGRLLILPTSNAPTTAPPPPSYVPPTPDFDDFEAAAPDREAERIRVPRDYVPPQDPFGQRIPAEPSQPDPDDPEAAPGARPLPRPGFPGGVPGSSRPGEILPVPQPDPDAPRIDDDP